MSVKIKVHALDGKILTRSRVRAERLVAAGTHERIDDYNIRELKPQNSNSDPARFLQAGFSLSDRFIDWEVESGLLPPLVWYRIPWTPTGDSAF